MYRPPGAAKDAPGWRDDCLGLEQLNYPSPEKFISAVALSIDGWSKWPPAFLVYQIDIAYLYHHQTRRTRTAELKHLPDHLRYGGHFAKVALKARSDFAAKEGVDPETLGQAWPDVPPKY
jgi:hypothetical protein